MKTLYLCYFGLREPLVQSQVLPYLRQVSGAGVEVFLLTFEPDKRRAWTKADEAEWRAKLAADGIRWFSLAYHKWPSAPVTVYDILHGAWTAARLARRYEIDVLHTRSQIPLAMALLAQRWCRCKLIFDIRGLVADEYLEAGIWTEGSPAYRAIKSLDRLGIRRADQLIVLTRRMRDWLIEQRLAPPEKIEVIPCCVDFSRFERDAATADATEEGVAKTKAVTSRVPAATDASVATVAAAERFELVYAGSVTGLYLLEEMGRFFLALKSARPSAFFRIMTMSAPEEASKVLRGVGLSDGDFWVGRVNPKDVPASMRRARLGISFRKATFSQMAASPTKIPEYLATGIPAISNAGIGDTDEVLEQEGVGVIVHNFDEGSYQQAVAEALALLDEADIGARSVAAAHRYFDLEEVGGRGYRNVYRKIEREKADAGIITASSSSSQTGR